MSRFKAPTLVIYLAGWLLFFTLPLLFMDGPREETALVPTLTSPYYWHFGLGFMALFYLNAYWLFPRLYLRGQPMLYFLMVLILLAGVHVMQPFDQLVRHHSGRAGGPAARAAHASPPGRFPPPGRWHGPPGAPQNQPGRGGPPPSKARNVDITSLFVFVMVMALSTATRLAEQWRETEQRAAKAEADRAHAEAEKVQAELSVLKAQIHPHFLFNTLNNIYSLAVTGSEHTATSIMKLSNLMRYVTDEVNEDFVPLQSEVDRIGDYIDLQRLRLSKKTTVEWEVSGDTAHKKIAPLLLIPFVENVFKYGVSNHTPSLIAIRLLIEENTIRFFCQNQIFSAPNHSERMGVGLANTRQRLAHLYPGKHTLHIGQDADLYTVQLTLQA